MKYMLLTNSPRGVLLDRTPTEITGDITLEFEGLPAGEYTVATVMTDPVRVKRIYRKVKDDKAIIERSVFDGCACEVDISVKNADLSREWICDGLITSGSTIYASTRNIEDIFIDLRLKLDEALSEISKLRRDVGEFSARVSEIYDGYDVI